MASLASQLLEQKLDNSQIPPLPFPRAMNSKHYLHSSLNTLFSNPQLDSHYLSSELTVQDLEML